MRSTVSGETYYHPEYIHYGNVDGDNTYGAAWHSFPRRAMVGGVCTSSENTPFNGSRCIEAELGTAYSTGAISYINIRYRGRDSCK